ncbi:MAG: tetratricopeptide repeat protein, partial [Pseudomonadales bacterium]
LFGLAIRKQHRYREALPWLQRTLELDPLSPDALIDLATTLSFTGAAQAAEDLYLRLIELAPQQIMSYRELAYHYVRQGQLNEAHDTWRRLLAISPDYLPAIYEIARIYLLLGDTETADQWIARLQAVPDESEFGQFIKGGALLTMDLQNEDFDSARDRVKRMRQIFEDNRFLLIYAAGVEAAAGDLDEARQYMDQAEQAAASDPNWPFSITFFHEGYPMLDGVLQGFLYLATDKKFEGVLKLKASLDFIESLWDQGWSVGVTSYVAAQIYAVQWRKRKAIGLLQRAYEEGWRDYRQALLDPALAALREEPEFDSLMNRMEGDATKVLAKLRSRNANVLPSSN